MSNLRLDVLTMVDVESIITWRNSALQMLRTPYQLTPEMQRHWYAEVVCDRRSPHRYHAIRDGNSFVGKGGLTNIQWENGLAEISLLISPQHRHQGYGCGAVDLLLADGFDRLRLLTIYGGCYCSNVEGLPFWRQICEIYQADQTLLPRRKWWAGRLWDSLYVSISVEQFQQHRMTKTEQP